MSANIKNKNVWVFIETEYGKEKKVGFELLKPGREIADAVKQELVAIVLGKDVKNVAAKAIAYGADKVILVDDPVFERYSTDAVTDTLMDLIHKYNPDTILIGATINGRDFGPRVACRLKTGLTADCTSISYNEETGNVKWTRPAFGGNLMADIECPNTRPQMGTVRPGVYKLPLFDEDKKGEIIEEECKVSQSGIRTKIIETIRKMFTEAFTAKGYISYTDLFFEENEVWAIAGNDTNYSSVFLDRILKEAVKKGYRAECCYRPLSPKKLQHLYLPEKKLIIVTAETPIHVKYDKVFDINGIMDVDGIRTHISEIERNLHLYGMLINNALDKLSETKKLHDILEVIYSNSMDFDAAEEVMEKYLGSHSLQDKMAGIIS
jgi:hypothetical protein